MKNVSKHQHDKNRRIATVDSCFALIGARQHCVAMICNASQTANAHKLQNDHFYIKFRTLHSLAPRNTRCHITCFHITCPLLRSCFIGSCHVGVSKRFPRSMQYLPIVFIFLPSGHGPSAVFALHGVYFSFKLRGHGPSAALALHSFIF